MPQEKLSKQEISKQIQRIEAELNQLRAMLASYDPRLPPKRVDGAWISSVLEARRQRDEVFGAGLFSDPAWDFLLGAYAYQLEGQLSTISDVCRLADITMTTGLRWAKELESAGLLLRQTDRKDRRSVLVSLSPKATDAMRRYFGEKPKPGDGL